LVLHQQGNGEFLVMRHERNYVDTENERKIRKKRKSE